MAISNNGINYINLNGFCGSGEASRYVDDVTGILLGIEPRPGTYQVKDRRTGEVITRPNSWTAHVAMPDGSIMYWSWPTYVDQNTNQVLPWSRFDSSINLGEVVAQKKVIHLWKDDRNFSHLELVETTVQMNPLPAAAPWEIAQ